MTPGLMKLEWVGCRWIGLDGTQLKRYSLDKVENGSKSFQPLEIERKYFIFLDCIPSLYQDLKNYGPHFFYLCEIIGKWVSPPSFGGETKEMMLWKGVWSGKRSHCWAQIEFLIPDLFSLDNFLLEPAPSWVWDMFQKNKSATMVKVKVKAEWYISYITWRK